MIFLSVVVTNRCCYIYIFNKHFVSMTFSIQYTVHTYKIECGIYRVSIYFLYDRLWGVGQWESNADLF